MAKISFEVTARTARLIGQENFSNAEGAIIELVKNSYDADANTVIVIFDLLYYSVPKELTIETYDKLSNQSNIVGQKYILEATNYILDKNLKEKDLAELRSFFRSRNNLYIIDDGEGLDSQAFKDRWMKIGTDNKVLKVTTNNGRVKTGAKGIGRFALDRLGSKTHLRTKPENENDGFDWQMEWEQFELPGKKVSDIKAELTPIPDFNLKKELILKKWGDKRIYKTISRKESDFRKGTMIKISKLRDFWDEDDLNKLYKGLGALIPPQGLGKFDIFLYQKGNINEFGEVSSTYFNDFDYKVEAEYLANELQVKMSITRTELDVKNIKTNYSKLFKDKMPPYDIETLENETFNYRKDIYKIIKWRKNAETDELLKRIGNFTFTFYFTKLTAPNTKDKKTYPYKNINYSAAKKTFETFGGIKIFRDYFRVRPYGEPGDDWLDLGPRQASSPASAGQRIGDWRVRSKQIAGTISISRNDNPGLKDKSDRSALIDNTEFNIFKNIIVGVISEFEHDRSVILNPFYLNKKEEEKKRREREARKAAEEIAKEIVAAQQSENKTDSTLVEKETGSTSEIIAKKLVEISEEQEEKNAKEESEKDVEIRLLRSLSSLGLIVASFDHELKAISNNLEPRLKYLKKHLRSLISVETSSKLPDNKNPFKLIDHIKNDHEKLKGWIDYSLKSIKVDKRKRTSLNFGAYFDRFKKNWKFVLSERNVNLVLTGNKSKDNTIRAFEIDMDTVFNNLLTNSLEAFKLRRERYSRQIEISWRLEGSKIDIIYKDNGVGLADVFSSPEEIFRPFVTTKRDKRGSAIGTGLGMYLVKNVVDDYSGEIEILKPSQGFMTKISIPKRK